MIVVAKLAGTAILARLFALTHATLMQLAWFAHWYPRWKAWKDPLIEEVRASSGWQAARRAKAAVSERWSALRRG